MKCKTGDVRMQKDLLRDGIWIWNDSNRQLCRRQKTVEWRLRNMAK